MGTRRVPMGEEEMAFEEWVQRLIGEPLEAGEQLIRYPLSTELHYQLVVVHARLDDAQATSVDLRAPPLGAHSRGTA